MPLLDALWPLARPALFRLDPERAHELSLRLLEQLPVSPPPAADPRLAVELAGLRFPTPVGLAAGYDKDARAPDALLGLGFGFVEVGTLTPLPQDGNPRPRIFRLVEDRAVINRLGFNNRGQADALGRLARRRRSGIVGVNVGANKDSADRVADYAAGVARMAPAADYLTVNISSPNTPGLRALQDRVALDELLAAVMEARSSTAVRVEQSRETLLDDARSERGVSVFLKIAPDLTPADIDDIAQVATARKVDALIVANTTISRPPLRSAHAREAGGLSGAPLRDLALQRLRDIRRATGGRMPLIAAGGIASAEDAYARVRAGASLVQIYSALVYEGPGLPRRIAAGLVKLLERDGFASVAQAVGSE